MHNSELAIDILQQINGAAKTVLARFQPISEFAAHPQHTLASLKRNGVW
jgi:hypothetical protein